MTPRAVSAIQVITAIVAIVNERRRRDLQRRLPLPYLHADEKTQQHVGDDHAADEQRMRRNELRSRRNRQIFQKTAKMGFIAR